MNQSSSIYLERVVCHPSMIRTVYHYCRAPYLLFRCGPLLHRNTAIGLPLRQRMTPGGTHFPDKWAAVISIGPFGQKCPNRNFFRVTGFENTCKGMYTCASAGTLTQWDRRVHAQVVARLYSQCLTRKNHSVIAIISNLNHFKLLQSLLHNILNPIIPEDNTNIICTNCTDFQQKVCFYVSVTVVCVFSMCKFSQAVKPSCFTVSSVLAVGACGWQEVSIKSFFTLWTFRRRCGQKMAANYSSRM